MCIAIAARAALRVLPTLASEFSSDQEGAIVPLAMALPIIRAIALPWAVASYPTRSVQLRAACAVAATDASDAGAAATTAAYAAGAAFYAIETTLASSYSKCAVDAVRAATEASTNARAQFVKGSRSGMDILREFSEDVPTILGGHSSKLLIGKALWSTRRPPEWVLHLWPKLKNMFHDGNQGWDVWTRWYDAVLAGHSTPGGEELDIYRVTLDSGDDWKKGPAHVNALIKAKEEEIAGRLGQTAAMNGFPEIAPLKHAAIEPVIVDGRIVLDRQPLTGSSGAEIERAAFATVKNEFQRLVQSIQNLNSVDFRFMSFALTVIAEIPDGAPTHEQLFRMGHVARTLQGYSATVNTEWPTLTASEYHAVTLQFEQSLRQYSAWRDFTKHATPLVLAEPQIDAINQSVDAIAELLEVANSLPFVDQTIPRLLRLLNKSESAMEADRIVKDGSDLLVADLLQSLSNVLNPVAQLALQYQKNWADGAKDALLDGAKEDGKTSIKWAKRVLIGLSTTALVTTLPAMFPSYLAWLPRVVEFVSKLGAG